jgi:hypothetical protein
MNPDRLQLKREYGGCFAAPMLLVLDAGQVLVHQADGEPLQQKGELVLDKPFGILKHTLLCLLL